MGSNDVTDFYTDVVLPRLHGQLDQAFPEFGWRRDRLGWVATNEETTHRILGVRAERVVAHGPAPRGFLVHGGDAMLWTAYLNGGAVPRGEQFVRTVKELAHRAGVNVSPIERPASRDQRVEILEAFFALCRKELIGERGSAARAYLEHRGIPASAIAECGLGLVPASARSFQALASAGYSPAEITGAGIDSDSRWPARLVGAWRDERAIARTLWARAIDNAEDGGSRYLYLRGASRTGLPPYGLSEVLSRPAVERRELVLVEGVLDVHQFRARGVANVAALGGTSIRPETFERLARRGFERVTLCLDRDDPGRQAAARAVEHAARAATAPTVYVVDPDALAPAKDPDAFVRERGVEAWRDLLAASECGVVWRASELLGGFVADEDRGARRDALARAGEWLGTLPRRLALEQEDAVRVVAGRCDYSAPATLRAFRARFWSEPEFGRPAGERRRESHAITPSLER